MKTYSEKIEANWPQIFNRYLEENKYITVENLPRRVRKRFHNVEVTCWEGFVNYQDIDGYVENLRLKFYLNRWRSRLGKDDDATPLTKDIYEIMKEADEEESKASKKPFHLERMASNIAINGIQEPIVLFDTGKSKAELWDGNRRFFGTLHIMKNDKFAGARERVKWIPAFVVEPSGDPVYDENLKHCVITELNFIEKDHIPWPAYVKAEQIYNGYMIKTSEDPTDPTLSRKVKESLAEEYGLTGWRVADRWIKMYDLALQFKEYHEEEHSRDETEVDLKIQDKFEYFDELSKPGVWGTLKHDPEARDEIFDWTWDEKFQAFTDVRFVPQILTDPAARRIANSDDQDAVKRAIQTVIANDPTRIKDKEAANEKIAQFAEWLDSFKREDFRQLNLESLKKLKLILTDVVKMIGGLLKPKKGGASSDE